jgi:hypothetical protein
MLSLAGPVLVKVSSSGLRAAQLQYPVCSCLVLANLTEQSLLALPKAGKVRTAKAGPAGVVVVVVVIVVVTSFAVGQQNYGSRTWIAR